MDEVNVKKTKYEELQSQNKEITNIVIQNRKDFDEFVLQNKKDLDSIINKLVDLKVEVLQLNSKVKEDVFTRDRMLGTTVQEYLGDNNSTEPMLVGGNPVDINGNPLKPIYDQKKYIKPKNEILIP